MSEKAFTAACLNLSPTQANRLNNLLDQIEVDTLVIVNNTVAQAEQHRSGDSMPIEHGDQDVLGIGCTLQHRGAPFYNSSIA